MTVARGGFEALDACVHCGFCLPACPTYLTTGDEADSPRGRIVLMRALERGEIAPTDPALLEHIDACLGCRGCEPACPSGVGYGRGLEAVRERLVQVNGLPALGRIVLGVFRRSVLWRPALTLARWFRNTGLPARFAGAGRVQFGLGMIASTVGRGAMARKRSVSEPPPGRGTVALFRGCVMDTLFDHVNDATARVLRANGYRVVQVRGQGCCGALHEHAGDGPAARALAARNVAAFGDPADYIVVNSAGCGALLKDYGHLLGTGAAAAFGSKVRDVTELLAAAGPVRGAPIDLDVCYDAPCHLQHAQRIHAEPLQMLAAVPDLNVRLLPGSDRCCGSAGIYGVLHPEMAGAVLADKIATIREATPRPDVIVTGNPGCLMQIGAGLRAAGLPIRVMHPVELIDWSYEVAGKYGDRDLPRRNEVGAE
ncbi:MAG: (Fe-S)-binding protein [Gemmatimonadota bacterium]